MSQDQLMDITSNTTAENLEDFFLLNEDLIKKLIESKTLTLDQFNQSFNVDNNSKDQLQKNEFLLFTVYRTPERFL